MKAYIIRNDNAEDLKRILQTFIEAGGDPTDDGEIKRYLAEHGDGLEAKEAGAN